MKHVKIERPDYAANHAAAIRKEHIPKGTKAPVVVRHEHVTLHCAYRACPDPTFTASFDEVQRIILCPSCGHEVFIPEAYRGMP